MPYVELQVTSNFSFLRGASHPDELVAQAASLGHTRIAITDRNTLAGIVRAHAAAREAGISIIPACRLDLLDGPSLLAYPTDKDAYSRLSALLTLGNLRAEKGKCFLNKEDVYAATEGLIFIIVPPDTLNEFYEFDDDFISAVAEYKRMIGNTLYIAAARTYQSSDNKRLFRIKELADRFRIKMVATNDVHYHDLSRRELQDVLTCVREKCNITDAGYKLHSNAERYLKPVSEMERIFRLYGEAINESQKIADACTFSLDELKYVYPEEINPTGRTPLEELIRLTWEGVERFYGKEPPEKVTKLINHELSLIKELDYANYFLFVEDVVREARRRGILCQGRGSAANSAVCYVLGITAVDPMKHNLLFERFISSARNEPPDIDVDFEHERREEMVQYVFNKYGRDRAAIVATVTQQRQKVAIRDVGKVMGLSQDTVDRLSAAIWEFTDEWFEPQRLIEQGLSPDDPHIKKVLKLTAEMMGFPRQLGQHTGGFVVTNGKLSDLCPIINARMIDRTNIEWNKDDIDALAFLKFDMLALGALTCIRKAFDFIKQHYGVELTLDNIEQDDPLVYDLARNADTVGVFQIESRAQRASTPILKPRNFNDLKIQVAIVRPGPIQGDMVHPYVRRRNGQEPVTYPSKAVEEILKPTLGVPLFQEQAMRIAMVAGGFTATEADKLRKSMATFKFKGLVKEFEEKLVSGMLARGYTLDYATRIFKQLEGFGSYGFPESHAASFALITYVTLYLKCYYPEAFAAALLNSQPMGFYTPSQIVSDAIAHKVEVRQIDVNYSEWDNYLEQRTGKYNPIRLGFRQIKGLREDDMLMLIAGREQPYKRITELYDAGVSQAALERLADADAFRSLGLDRRKALWEVAALSDIPQGLFKGQSAKPKNNKQIELPFMTLAEHVIQDYASTSLSLKAHPVSLIRDKLKRLEILSSEEVRNTQPGKYVRVAGLVTVRQRPGTAGGVCFISIEDETGDLQLITFEKLFETYRREILGARLLMVTGMLQREGIVQNIIVRTCHDLTPMIGEAVQEAKDASQMPFHAVNKRTQIREDASGKTIPKARNFR